MADSNLELLYQKILGGNFHEPGHEDLSYRDCERHTSSLEVQVNYWYVFIKQWKSFDQGPNGNQ